MSSRYDLSENHAAILRTSTWPCVRTRRTASIEPKGKGRRQWFERGEVAALMKRLVKAPMAQADIVRALAQSKGYDR